MVQTQVPVAIRNPLFEEERFFPLGVSVADVADSLFGRISAGAVAFLRCPPGSAQQWMVLPREMWRFVRPKGRNCLRFEYVPAGGGGKSQTIAIVAAIAISIAAPYLASAAVGALALTGTAAAVATSALTAGIAIGGNLLVAKLFPPAQPGVDKPKSDSAQEAFANVDTDANVLAEDLAPPKVIGTSRIAPPDLCEPWRYLLNGQEHVKRVLGLTGRHSITDIRIGDADIDDISGVSYEVKDGSETASQQHTMNRVVKNKPVGQRMRQFEVETDSQAILDQATPANSEPKERILRPGYFEDMEQVTLRVTLDPMVYTSSETADIRLPVRIKFRAVGESTWNNVPEIHIVGRKTIALPKEINFRWDDNFAAVSASTDFSYVFYREVPAAETTLSDGSSGTQWEAHSDFSDGAGYQDTVNIAGTADGVNIKLDPDTFPIAEYEFCVVVGHPVRSSLFSASDYEISSTVESLFISKLLGSGKWGVPTSLDGVSGGLQIDWTTYVVNRFPVEKPGIVQIALDITSTDARDITCLAASYVMDWDDGSPGAWNDESTTDNPAPHFRQVLVDWLTFYGVDTSLIADDEILAWRTECASQGYKVSYIASGQAVSEVLEQIATAGFATKRFGFGFGVDYFRDTSGETPIMTFSNRDCLITAERVFPDSVKGARIKFRNAADDYSDDEVTINNPWGQTSIPENANMTYQSIADEDLAIKRAQFDLLQEEYRKIIWTVRAGPAGFNRVKGELVNVVTDLDSDYAHGFFIRQVVADDAVAVDRAVPGLDSGDIMSVADLTAEESLVVLGATATASIVTASGVETYTIAAVSGETIQFTEDLSTTDLVGARMVVTGLAGQLRRCHVLDVDRSDDQGATLKLVDEAPEIWTKLQKAVA